MITSLKTKRNFISRLVSPDTGRIVTMSGSPDVIRLKRRLTHGRKLSGLRCHLNSVRTPPVGPNAISLTLLDRTLRRTRGPSETLRTT